MYQGFAEAQPSMKLPRRSRAASQRSQRYSSVNMVLGMPSP